MTLLQALTHAQKMLSSHADVLPGTSERLDSPRLDAEVLLAHTLGTDRSRLAARLEQEISELDAEKFFKLIERRAAHEPVAYLIGYKPFYGRDFNVNRSTLIPRPETETLIEESLAKATDKTLYIDVGTGSGAIAITLAAETGKNVIATEDSAETLETAKANSKKHKVQKLVDFRLGDLIEPIQPEDLRPYERVVITANLPYLTSNQWNTTPAEVKNFEPRHALDGGADGLDYYRRLMAEIKKRRNEFPAELFVIIEIDPDQAGLIEQPAMIKKDLGGRDRIGIVSFRGRII